MAARYTGRIYVGEEPFTHPDFETGLSGNNHYKLLNDLRDIVDEYLEPMWALEHAVNYRIFDHFRGIESRSAYAYPRQKK